MEVIRTRFVILRGIKEPFEGSCDILNLLEIGSGPGTNKFCSMKNKAAISLKGMKMAQKALKTSAEGRVCQFPNCTRLLSIYNHQTYCRVHLEQMAESSKPKPYHCNAR